MKYFPLVGFMLCSLLVCQADAFTVVLKNGKTLQGTLISESADGIVFKDSSGVQYSLKKSALDLQKMQVANTVKEEPAAPPAAAPVETTKKKTRVYTQQDLESLREKYSDLSTGNPIENIEDFEGGVLKPEAYLKYMKEGAGRVDKILTDISVIRDTVATNWEIGDSTGKGGSELIKEYLAKPGAAEISAIADQELASLRSLQGTLSEHPPNLKEGYDLFTGIVSGASDYVQSVRNFETADNANLYLSRLSEMETQIRGNLNKIQAWQPAPPKKETEKPAEPPAEEKEESPETQTEQE